MDYTGFRDPDRSLSEVLDKEQKAIPAPGFIISADDEQGRRHGHRGLPEITQQTRSSAGKDTQRPDFHTVGETQTGLRPRGWSRAADPAASCVAKGRTFTSSAAHLAVLVGTDASCFTQPWVPLCPPAQGQLLQGISVTRHVSVVRAVYHLTGMLHNVTEQGTQRCDYSCKTNSQPQEQLLSLRTKVTRGREPA